MNSVWAILLATLLIALNAFFVAAEFSMISARRDRLEALAEQGAGRLGDPVRDTRVGQHGRQIGQGRAEPPVRGP